MILSSRLGSAKAHARPCSILFLLYFKNSGVKDQLEYLARYTHRVAIANSRIKSLKGGMVTFSAKNRKENRTELITVSAVEFIRRFLLRSLPNGFVRIRHYGFLANRNRKANLAQIKTIMGSVPEAQEREPCLEEIMCRLVGIGITVCPCCQKGKMHLFAQITTYRAPAVLVQNNRSVF